MSGTSLCSAEDALRFGVVPQQVALAARQFVHSEILLRHIKKGNSANVDSSAFALKAPVSMVRTDWGPAHLRRESGGRPHVAYSGQMLSGSQRYP